MKLATATGYSSDGDESSSTVFSLQWYGTTSSSGTERWNNISFTQFTSQAAPTIYY